MVAQPLSTSALLRWLGGPLVWAVHLMFVYASESLVCTRGAGAESHFLLVGVISTSAVIAVLIVTTVNLRGRASIADDGPSFMDKVAVALGGLSLVAVLWTALPASLIPACSSTV